MALGIKTDGELVVSHGAAVAKRLDFGTRYSGVRRQSDQKLFEPLKQKGYRSHVADLMTE